MTDLGTMGTDPCSRALMMNSHGQIVGTTIAVCGELSTHAFLWENGGPMIDLNTLIPPNSGVLLNEADNINERGEIVASGLPPGCDDRFVCGRVYLLVPCGANDASGCENAEVSTAAAVQNRSALVANNIAMSTRSRSRPSGGMAAWRTGMAPQYHVSVPGSAIPKN
jgi:probable HAF family extracellular repeat protein